VRPEHKQTRQTTGMGGRHLEARTQGKGSTACRHSADCNQTQQQKTAAAGDGITGVLVRHQRCTIMVWYGILGFNIPLDIV